MSNLVLSGSHDTDKPVSRFTCVTRSFGFVDLASRVTKTATCFLALGVVARLVRFSERSSNTLPFQRIMAESGWVVVSAAERTRLFFLSATFSHRICVGVAPGLSSDRCLKAVGDVLMLTWLRRRFLLLQGGPGRHCRSLVDLPLH